MEWGQRSLVRLSESGDVAHPLHWMDAQLWQQAAEVLTQNLGGTQNDRVGHSQARHRCQRRGPVNG